MEKNKSYLHLSRRLACSNSLFNVYFDHLSDAKKDVEDYLIVRPKTSIGKDSIVGVCVLPEVNSRYCLMRGWRHQFDDLIWQAPAGFVDEGENPSEAAIRELREETSLICKPSNLISLGSFIPDAGLMQGRVALYLAKDSKLLSDEISHEIGTGKLYYFNSEKLMNLISNESNIGGSTIVTSLRAIKYTE